MLRRSLLFPLCSVVHFVFRFWPFGFAVAVNYSLGICSILCCCCFSSFTPSTLVVAVVVAFEGHVTCLSAPNSRSKHPLLTIYLQSHFLGDSALILRAMRRQPQKPCTTLIQQEVRHSFIAIVNHGIRELKKTWPECYLQQSRHRVSFTFNTK